MGASSDGFNAHPYDEEWGSFFDSLGVEVEEAVQSGLSAGEVLELDPALVRLDAMLALMSRTPSTGEVGLAQIDRWDRQFWTRSASNKRRYETIKA